MQYHAAFAAGLELAIKKKRLAEDTSPGLPERPSMIHEALMGQSPWLQAQADLYFLVGQTLAKKQCLDNLNTLLRMLTPFRFRLAQETC